MQPTSQQQRRTQRLAELREQHEWEEQERRDRVIAEFGGDPHALAAEILRYRRGLAQVADGIAWMQAGAPFVSLGPGPYWKPRLTPILDDREIENDRCA
jgi:3-deoxy-D-arabino-heptulosonate 7-phosphate (DAHP) synthase class II